MTKRSNFKRSSVKRGGAKRRTYRKMSNQMRKKSRRYLGGKEHSDAVVKRHCETKLNQEWLSQPSTGKHTKYTEDDMKNCIKKEKERLDSIW